MQDVAASGQAQQSPASTAKQQDGPPTQPSHHHGDHHMALLSATAAADHVQCPGASSDAAPASLSGSPHIAHEQPVMQETLAQRPVPLPVSQHLQSTEATAAGVEVAAMAADEVCQAPGNHSQGISASATAQSFGLDIQLPAHHQSPGITAHPMAASFELEAKPPVAMVASQAHAVPSSAYLDGHIRSSHQSWPPGQDGLAGLAAEVYRWEQRVLIPPVEQPALEVASQQQPVADSNGWHEEERHANYRQQQGDVSNEGLVVPYCGGSQEPVQSCTAKDNSHGLVACEGQSQDVPVAQYVAQTNAPPDQSISQSAEPLFVGKKRQLDVGDGPIVAKKQCVSLSGTV